MKHVQHSLMNFFTITAYMAKLNILWLIFTLLGGIVLGIGPATAVTVRFLYEFRTTGHDYTIIDFYQTYKKCFRVFSLVGALCSIMILLLLFNLRILILFFTGIPWLSTFYVVFLLLFAYCELIFFLTYAKAKESSIKQSIYASIFMIFRYPLHGIALIASWYILIMIMGTKTSLFLIAGISTLLFFAEFFHNQMIRKMKELQIKRGSDHATTKANQPF
ncbi:DUF624 domain-containing protein [Enterococcus sp.]|uniref:DUF624 domain-containing protein n=1 Tax=Enterococcus sp. TaxID=35783 RepID=UPI0025C0A76F|nr:DUF624 domain-containing protein [Enterococcus sp.]